ncbi:MAG: hypothetical protein N4A59_14440 [Marinifilum sp.]|jgi:hypothetical protein|nr:hypothetical protein [Marinifilum sp.]
MEENENLQAFQPELDALAKEDIKTCGMPISIYLQEMENLHKRTKLDFSALEKVGLLIERVNRLELLTALLRYAEVEWQEVKSERQIARENWQKEIPFLYNYRDDLLDTLEFAFRNDDSLMEHINEIKIGNSHADAIQDLARMAVLGKENPELVATIKSPQLNFDEANQLAKRMADLLAKANGYMYGDNGKKILRDKVFTLLDAEATEIRKHGRFVFRKDKDHLKAYYSKYQRERSAAYRRSKKDQSDK